QREESGCAAGNESPGGSALRHDLAGEGCDQAGGRVQQFASVGEGRPRGALAEWREGGGWDVEGSGRGEGVGGALGNGIAGVRPAGKSAAQGMPDFGPES